MCTLNKQNCVKLFTLNIQNYIHSLQNFVYEYTKICTFFEGLNIECTNLTLLVICEEKCPQIIKLCMLNI